jgi:glycine betaine catabolism A
VLRDRDGQIRAFHNICRHRGALLCEAQQGKAALLACSYHHWSYGLDGRLISARTMPPDFRKEDFPLRPIALSNVEGMLFVCLADTPPDPAPFADAVGPYIAPHGGNGRVKVAHQSRIVERGNWKLVIENNRECYHCPGNHPEFLTASFGTLTGDDPAASDEFRDVFADRSAAWAAGGVPYLPADGDIDFRCIRMPLRKGFVSFTMDGGPGSARVLGDLPEQDMGSLRLFRPPNCWHHYLGDHIIHFRVLPLTPDTSELQTTWLVHEDAVEGVDYDVERLTQVWRLTNDQDRALVEKNQAGIASRGYQPGPQSAEEVMVDQFQSWYARELSKVLA